MVDITGLKENIFRQIEIPVDEAFNILAEETATSKYHSREVVAIQNSDILTRYRSYNVEKVDVLSFDDLIRIREEETPLV